MRFGGICIETDNAPRLAEFYKIVFQEEPFVEGSHYGFCVRLTDAVLFSHGTKYEMDFAGGGKYHA